ncbi:hypothetical protein V2J09_009632 [Rumex salicifolius]
MEEEHHHHHQHYGGGGSSNSTPAMTDLRQFFSPIPTHHHHHQFPPPPTLYSPATVAAFPHHYDAMMLVMGAGGGGHGGQDFRADNSAGVTAAMVPSSSAGAGFDMENAAGGGFGLGVGGGDGGATARWPRQETLTLLEIRSRLDHKFKEANHKGPLWDEVSRIMCEEHGYQRSGKKCREKFENLYKYYKKTKEGKAGRQDGKHYRFFRQLEALYGDSTHHNPVIISNHTTTATATATTALEFHSSMNRSISISNNDTSSDFSTSSSEEEDDVERVGSMDSSMAGGRGRKRRGTGRSWKAKIKEFIESQMRKVMEKQEAWLEKMMSGLEHREKERIMREEEWRKQEVMRMEREHRFWARERAWIEARDKALMDALQRITGKDVGSLTTHDHDHQRWEESEMMKLVELRASVEERFDECGGGPGESGLWEEISSRMACLGHDRSAKMCKEKWEFISKELGKKRSHQHQHQHQHQHHHNQYQHQEHHLQTTKLLYNYGTHEMNGQVLGTPPPPPPNPMNDSCLRILLGDGGGGGGETNPWESYGVKLINKGD